MASCREGASVALQADKIFCHSMGKLPVTDLPVLFGLTYILLCEQMHMYSFVQ